MRAAVLRLLLTGCLFTQHVISQHRQKTATVSMGASLTLSTFLGIAATMTNFRTLLTPDIWNLVSACKPCFRYATIVTTNGPCQGFTADARIYLARKHMELFGI